MKRNLLKLLLLVVALVMGIGASAQTDLTATYLNNADFASANGWTAVTSNSFKDFGVGKIGSYQVRSEFPAATVDATHLNSESCAGFECRWSGNYASYTQTSKEALPAGTYALSYDVENTNEGTANANYESRFFVKVGDTTFKDESSEWMKGKSNWTKHYIVFKLSEASKFTVSLGWGTGDNNIGHMNTPALFVSHLKLSKLQNAEFPVDITSFVQNPEFRNLAQNAFPGWTTIHQQGDAKPIGSIGGEFWSWNKSAANFDFYQTVENLPNGKYTITANMWHSKDGEGDASVDGAVGVYGSSGNNNVFKGITTDTREDGRTDYTTDEIEVTNGTLRVGVKNNSAMHARWFGVDYIKLTLVSLTPPNASMIEAKYAEVDATKPMNATTKQNLANAYSAAKADVNFDTYDALSIAVDAAKTSIATYELIKDRIDISKSIIYNNAGLNTSSIDDKYANGQYPDDYNADEIYREFATLYNTQTEAAPGKDFTPGIVNPSFDPGNAVGWTIEKTGTAWQNAQMKPGDSRNAYEYWANSASGGGFNFHQDITGLPAGIYTISAEMLNSTNGEAGASFGPEGQVGVYISNGTQESFGPVTVDKESLSRYTSDPFIVKENEVITVGVKNRSQMTGRWFAVDDFKLTYVNSVADYIADLKAQLTEEEAKAQFEADANAAVANNDVAGIDAAFQAAIRTQLSEGANYTGAIVNPSFETGSLHGWTVTSSDDTGVKPNSNGTYTTEGCDGDYVFNTWWKGNPITQTIENLPNGIYKLKALMANDAAAATLYLIGNGAHSKAFTSNGNKGVFTECSLEFAVTDGKATIGAIGGNDDGSFNQEGYYWYKADNFRLEFVKEIETYDVNTLASMIASGNAPEDSFILEFEGAEVLNVGNDSIVAQKEAAIELPSARRVVEQEKEALIVGVLLKGTGSVNKKGNVAYGTAIGGKIYGTFDAATHTFAIETNSGNEISAQSQIEPTVSKLTAEEAADLAHAYKLVSIEVATIQNDEDGIFAKQGEAKVAIDKRIAGEELVLNDGDIVNSITGITFLEAEASVLAPLSQDAIVPLLWNAENIDEGEVKDNDNPIDLTTSDVMARMQNLTAGDVLKVQTIIPQAARRNEVAEPEEENNVIVTTADGRNIFTIPAESNVVEVPITPAIQEEVNKHGLKIAVNGVNAQLVTVLNAKYDVEDKDKETTIWLGEGNNATLGKVNFEDVRKGDIINIEGDGALTAGDVNITPSAELNEAQAAALLDGTLKLDGKITRVIFALGNDPRNDTAKPEAGDSYEQGGNMEGIDGMIMTFGGSDETPNYEFEEVYPKVNKFGAVTNGINQFPVDGEGNAYDPEKKNLPTKGTYYVFEPTKDGVLTATVGVEKGKTIIVTEDGESIFNEKTAADFEGEIGPFNVEATKTYYIFANETNMKLFGFKFIPSDADAQNLVKNIANFKLIPVDNAEGDTLTLKDAVVNYIKGDNVFVEDASGATVFFKTAIQYYVGQKLNGYIIGQNHVAESNMPQLLRTDKTNYKSFKVTETVTPEPTVISIAEALKKTSLARFVKFVDVRAKKDSKGFRIITDGKNSIRLEDHFNVFYEMPEVIGIIEGIVGIDKEGTFYIWPTSKEGVSEGVGLTEAEEALLAEAMKLASDREAVAVGLLDDEIVKAEAGYGKGLQAAIDLFKENNANNAKETYAKDKVAMQALIDEAEELLADETLQNNREELAAALEAGKTAQASIRLNVPQFEEEIVKLRQAIADFKEANHIGGNFLATGKYVLKNVASGLYWGAGNNWGTRASLLDYSEYQTLTQQPDGTYTMESQVSNGGTKYYFNQDGNSLYMDNGNPTALTITPVEVEGEATEEVIDFNASLYHNWSEVSGTATDNGSANGGVKLNEEVALGGVLWGNLSGAVPYKDYANITDYKELRIEGTPGAMLRLMCNRVTDEGPIYELKPTIPEDGKLTIKISDLMFLNGGTPCDFVALQSIKIPAGWQGGTTAATITSMKLVKAAEPQKKVLYTVANGDNYFGCAEEDPNDKPYTVGTAILRNGLAADDENALWEIVPATTEALAAATEDEPMDATFLILNPNFGRNNRNGNAWTMEAGNKNLCGGTNENKCAESWRSAFTLSQEIELPNGVYALTAQAALSDYAHLYDGANYPVVYANEVTATFNNMEGADRESNMDKLSASFAAGNYKVGPLYVEVTDGKMTIGVKGTRTDTWCIWDNFQLMYYGENADIANISGGAEAKELEQLRKKASELENDADIEIAAVKTGLTNALSETANVSGKDAIKAAIATLTAAIDKAEASKTAKNVLPKMKELVDATNVYTQDAYDNYYGTWLAKYEAGTLTKAEAGNLQDPSVTTGWHAQITVDNFLLSAWDTNPDFNDAAYYINSWSTEGDNDGTNFRVPFFEYFGGEGSPLGEKTLTATMTGLAAGDYTVTAWARARVMTADETSAYGITFQANDGEAVNVCDGNQTDRFFLKEVTAKGKVGADGVLNIKFNVAAENNIHWLSFKNVKFEKAGVAEDPELVAPAGWMSMISNGNLASDETANYYAKEAPASDPSLAVVTPGAGKNGSRGILVKAQDKVSQAWDTQFWIKTNETLPAGTKVHVEFDYKADKAAKASTQSHGAPSTYMHWACIGDVNFTEEWQHFATDFEVASEADGMQSIAFNLNEFAEANNYYFDNFGVWVQKPAPVSEWIDIAVNGTLDQENIANECFYVTEQGVARPYLAEPVKGLGKDGGYAIKVQSADNPSQDWDSQFFIRMPYKLPAGTKFRVSFDYMADKAGDFDTQAHAEPSDYIHNACIGSGSFTTEWQHYEKEVSVSGDMSKADNMMQSIAFNLAKNKAATRFVFDNIKIEVPSDVLATLTQNPSLKPVLDPTLIEVAQDQGKSLDDFERTGFEEGENFNTYTATGDLQVAFKMYDIDVADCDYVVVKFAEPVKAGWCVAFWAQGGTDNVGVAEGATEYKYVFADDQKCAVQNDVLPQICMLTLWGAQKPLVANIRGIYKHQIPTVVDKVDGIANNVINDGAVYNLRGQKVTGTLKPGLYIKNGKKVVIK